MGRDLAEASRSLTAGKRVIVLLVPTPAALPLFAPCWDELAPEQERDPPSRLTEPGPAGACQQSRQSQWGRGNDA